MSRVSTLGTVLLAATISACTPNTPPSRATPPAASSRPAPPAPADEAWRSEVPAPAQAAQLSYPAPELSTLPNGLTVAFLRRPARVATLLFVVRHGQSSVKSGKSGLAALTVRMLTEGTRDKSGSTLAEAVESLGTTLESDAGRDESTLTLSTLSEDVPRGLELLAEVVQTPVFSQADFDRVRREWVDGLVAERQSPTRLASLVGLRLLLGGDHGAPVGGGVPDIEKLTRADLVEFHRTRYAPSDSAVVIVGDVDPALARRSVEKTFGRWKAKRRAPPPVLAKIPTDSPTGVVLVDRPGSVQSALFLAQRLPPRSAPGHEARLLLSSLLGGLFTSRINKNLREEHAYTYGARSDVAATRDWGAFVIQTSVETPTTADALRQVLAELSKARDPSLGAPIGLEEISRARSDLTSSLGAHLEQTSRVADDLATLFVHGLPRSYYSDYQKTLDQVSPAAIDGEARRIEPTRQVIVVVGDRAATQPALEQSGLSVKLADDALTR